MTLAILQVGRENQAFERVYQEVVEKYATEGDEVKTVERYLTLSKDLISSKEISPDEVRVQKICIKIAFLDKHNLLRKASYLYAKICSSLGSKIPVCSASYRISLI